MNNVCLIGRMTRDPELRKTQSGNAVTSFTLAVDRGFNSSDGQTADFIPCVVWNKAAESVARYQKKGSKVGIEGKLQSRSYNDSQGRKVYVVEVVCSRVDFLDARSSNTQDATAQGVVQSMPQQQPSQNGNGYNANSGFAQPQFDANPQMANFPFDISEDDINF